MSGPTRLSLAAAVLVTVVGTGAAHADVVRGSGDVPAVSDAPMGKLAVRRGVQGPQGLFTARLLLLVNASKNSFGKPTSFAPDLFYSLTDTVQLGLVHTGPMGWQSRPGLGLCLAGKDNGCPRYNNVGLDFMYGLLYGDFHLSLHSTLYLLFNAPTNVMWTVGITGKFHFNDTVALFFDPQIGIILSHRDQNKDQLYVPIELQIQASTAVSIKLLSGVLGQLSALGDTYQVPFGIGVVGNVSRSVDLGLRFSFDNLLGYVPQGFSRTDSRSIGLLLNFRT